MQKVDISKLPELRTRVGIHGSTKQREVGGGTCLGMLIALTAGRIGLATGGPLGRMIASMYVRTDA